MNYLRYGTTAYKLIGPIVDAVSGTSMTTNALSTAADSAFLHKHGSTVSTTMQALTAWSSIEAGYMLYPFTTGETDTHGTLVLNMTDESLFLPVRHEFQVIGQQTYDGLFGTSATTVHVKVNVQQINSAETTGTGITADKWRG